MLAMKRRGHEMITIYIRDEIFSVGVRGRLPASRDEPRALAAVGGFAASCHATPRRRAMPPQQNYAHFYASPVIYFAAEATFKHYRAREGATISVISIRAMMPRYWLRKLIFILYGGAIVRFYFHIIICYRPILRKRCSAVNIVFDLFWPLARLRHPMVLPAPHATVTMPSRAARSPERATLLPLFDSRAFFGTH